VAPSSKVSVLIVIYLD